MQAPNKRHLLDTGYVAFKISKLDIYLAFTLACSIAITTYSVTHNFNMGFVIFAAIFLFLTIERSKQRLCQVLNKVHTAIEQYIMPEAQQKPQSLTSTRHFMHSS